MKKQRTKNSIQHPFSPIIYPNSKILILGSFPSVISRENDFYYGNPKNRFWKVLGLIFDKDFISLSNEEKVNALKELHIALYDVVYSCTIDNSSDSSIEDVVYADIPSLIENTEINHIYCNGKKAYALLLKAYPMYKDRTVLLPSTSPANAAWNIDRLFEKWNELKLH